MRDGHEASSGEEKEKYTVTVYDLMARCSANKAFIFTERIIDQFQDAGVTVKLRVV